MNVLYPALKNITDTKYMVLILILPISIFLTVISVSSAGLQLLIINL